MEIERSRIDFMYAVLYRYQEANQYPRLNYVDAERNRLMISLHHIEGNFRTVEGDGHYFSDHHSEEVLPILFICLFHTS